jgi:cell division protein FtsI (penicillin-binding protein 3)
LKRRALVAAVLLAAWAAGIEGRLVYLQVARHQELLARAARQQNDVFDAPALRGDILDRRGRVLATSADADSIYAVPTDIEDPEAAVQVLCRAFGDCTDRERQILAERFSRTRPFAYVRRHVSPEQARRVAALKLHGVGFLKESRRFYPNKELAAHLLGYVGIDNTGLSGIEYAYDAQIRGRSGTVLIHTDARGQAFSRFERPPTVGSSVELTIDEYLQHVAERELAAGVAANRAAGGSAIVMDPHSGEILALANVPTFNPNVFARFDVQARRNRAVQDLYEPGSTFKVVTASAAIEDRVMPLHTPIDTSPGHLRIGSRVIREDANNDYGVLSFEDVIVKSSNVGAIRIGFKVGVARLSRFVALFGFGRPLSRDFPEESPGIVWSPEKWTDSALASVSMGYQIGVTALQMVAAASAVANGGELVEPRVVRGFSRDGQRYLVQPTVLGRAVSRPTADALTTIMEEVVRRGTAKRAQVPGYEIAGKTGTAAKLVKGRYSRSEYNASFVGFAPSRNPVVAIIVVVDSPHGAAGYHGGPVSAPIFRRIAEASLRYLGVPPDLNAPPPVLVKRGGAAPLRSASRPEVGRPVVSLVAHGEAGRVPDLTGLGAREAVRRLVAIGMSARLSGDGFVVLQDPMPGEPVEAGAVCHLFLDRVPRPQCEGAP